MIIEKSVTFEESVQNIWDKIIDLESIIHCMPGVQNVKVVGDNHFRVEVAQKVGFISAKFTVELKVTNLEPPTHMETAADGTALGGLGMAFQKQTLDLIAISERETKLVYKGDITLSGKIGTFGHRRLGGKINSIADEFLKNFAAKSGLKVVTP